MSDTKIIWSVIGYKDITNKEDEYLIGYVYSLSTKTQKAAESLGRQMCHTHGYHFKHLVLGDVMEHINDR